jgi:hypothetical protein
VATQRLADAQDLLHVLEAAAEEVLRPRQNDAGRAQVPVPRVPPRPSGRPSGGGAAFEALGVEAGMMHWQSFIYGASAMAFCVLVIELACWWFRRRKS